MARSVILLTKEDRFSRLAWDGAREAFGTSLRIFSGSVGDPEPAALEREGPDVLLSFLSPWIVRRETLDRCGTAINFHPGPAEYPGTGCYNFALYDEAPEYGAVCHHMLPKVDTGPIVLERRFPLSPHDTVETLKLAAMEVMLEMFGEMVALIAAGHQLPRSAARWARVPYTRRELEALKVLRCSMPAQEIARRVRATVYPGYSGPVLHRGDGSSFAFPVPDRAALA